jgi:hypothetical protein
VSRRKITLQASAPTLAIPISGGSDDPRCNGDPPGIVKAHLTVASASTGQVINPYLPCENWRSLGAVSAPTGYAYSDPTLAQGPVRSLVESQRLLLAVLKGSGLSPLGYDLQIGVDQGVVDELRAAMPALPRCDDSNAPMAATAAVPGPRRAVWRHPPV